ncbi:MAG: YihA family ribosome biogenesis GTP-binding protein [Erysipelotrichaceae bacterium]|nr:YihA family ribosome biogenesis GTP-binding protein [Erysipelotrichaceae bacterium]
MIRFLCSARSSSQYPETEREAVFVGRSNVGKSSLINALYGKIAYVGKTPGKTKLLNFFSVDERYSVCDVPGYGYAEISDKETIDFGEMMEEYFSKRKEIRLCVMIMDIRRTPNADDLDMYDFLVYNNIPCVFVLNKADKLSYAKIEAQKENICKILEVEKDDLIVCSSLKKTDIDVLKRAIEDRLLL